MPEALALERPERAVQLLHLLSDDVRAEVTVFARLVAVVADALRHVEDHRHRQDMELASERDGVLARLGLDVGGVDDRDPSGRQALLRDVVQDVEGIVGRGLVVLVVRDQASALVGRENLGRLEVLAREARFPAPRRPHEHDEREFRDLDPHWENTAICVGAPSCSSTGPTGANRAT